jgi:hypothetical protein
MHPSFACNLITTVSLPPWKEGLDWGLQTTDEWEKHVPFHAYVRSRPGANRVQHRHVYLFPLFSTLPAELQFHILAFCPAHTLFRMMHVSSALRAEASKLFWATSGASFLVGADWLLGGGYQGDTYRDLPFMHHVQRVEIEYHRGFDAEICFKGNDERLSARQDQITRFWESLVLRLPNVNRVLFNQGYETPLWWEDGKQMTQPLQILLQARPIGLEVAVLVLEETVVIDASIPVPPTRRWQRSLYQPSVDGGWVKAHNYRREATILMPTKQFQGPVGEFHRLLHEAEGIYDQREGLWPLMIEALDRYYFDDGREVPFDCPLASCGTQFTRAGEWSIHAVDVHCEAWAAGDSMAFLPKALGEVFEKKVIALQETLEHKRKQLKVLREDWDRAGKHKRKEMERVAGTFCLF